MKNKIFCSLLVASLTISVISTGGCTKTPNPEPTQGKKIATEVKEQRLPIHESNLISESRNIIEITADGEILLFQRESFFNASVFSEILKSKEKYEAKEIDSLKSTLKKYHRDFANTVMKFDSTRCLTVFKCDIKDAKEGHWFDFDWFLRPYGLDFLDSKFKREERGLHWEGEVDGVKTIINIKFPFNISNCHEHVWKIK